MNVCGLLIINCGVLTKLCEFAASSCLSRCSFSQALPFSLPQRSIARTILFANDFSRKRNLRTPRRCRSIRSDLKASTLLGMIDLFANRLDDAEKICDVRREVARSQPWRRIC